MDSSPVVKTETPAAPAVPETVNVNGVFVASQGAGRFRVDCSPPTPVAHIRVECDAGNESEAWDTFCRQNGITDTNAERTIRRIGERTGAPPALGERSPATILGPEKPNNAA